MATSFVTSDLVVRASTQVVTTRRCAVRRRISPQAGHALEILGHAIEYLTDEYVHAGGEFSARDGEVQAVQLLMKLNRQIYLDCPAVPSLAERCRALLHLRPA